MGGRKITMSDQELLDEHWNTIDKLVTDNLRVQHIAAKENSRLRRKVKELQAELDSYTSKVRLQEEKIYRLKTDLEIARGCAKERHLVYVACVEEKNRLLDILTQSYVYSTIPSISK